MVVVKYTNKGGAKVFKNVPDKDVFKFFKDTAGVKEMPKAQKVFDKKSGKFKGEIYIIKKDGVDYILRDFATQKSKDGSVFSWTLQIKELPNTKNNIELKFK
ncbi:hypothetical protein [Campylobacter sputorum]|uniref:hypothetical protein n=1 Tax=Campylobacter sputorum TaxID=206 RepID=UPI000B7994C6|nr:hypothetical protein [Campylobacter sputorum]ASM36857.1 hypothetical protein CSF_0988 [Campylobacter sputorum bv. faecalis CCUG 20703]